MTPAALARAPWPAGERLARRDSDQARWNYGPLGVWAREFEGGIAIMNPKGNGPVTLTIQDLGGQRWKHFYGSQDPETNNGQDVTGSITLADRDGIILLRRHPLGDGKK
jgi:hypothetical protein